MSVSHTMQQNIPQPKVSQTAKVMSVILNVLNPQKGCFHHQQGVEQDSLASLT